VKTRSSAITDNKSWAVLLRHLSGMLFICRSEDRTHNTTMSNPASAENGRFVKSGQPPPDLIVGFDAAFMRI